jgi:uncharacterized repeat protein (TIGR01451 family)
MQPTSRHRAVRIGWLFAALAAVVPVAALSLADFGAAAPPGATDLSISKAVSATKVQARATVTYTIKVDDLGPLPASGVTVTDQLPRGANFVSASSTLGSCANSSNKVTCSIGNLAPGLNAPGSSATISLNAVLTQGGTITNTASVKADQKDTTGKNDKASVSTQVAGGATVACRKKPATIIGTTGNDRIKGTPGRDVIVTFGGNDRIVARGERDLVCAGKGNDFIDAGGGADRVYAGAGRDKALGRGGPDFLNGGGANDILKGQRGKDTLRGAKGFDRCYGGAGSDSIRCERKR